MSKIICFASSNKNKLLEVKSNAEHYGIEIYSPIEIAKKLDLADFQDPEENGSTYLENSLIKSKACFNWCGIPTIGDDSGVEVNILDNAPGILSARYAGKGADDSKKIEKLVSEFKTSCANKKIIDRSARFRCLLTYVSNNTIKKDPGYIQAEGILEGEILDTPTGNRGFGYDPIIKIHEFNATLAEISFDLLISNGFRAKACQGLFNKLKEIGEI